MSKIPTVKIVADTDVGYIIINECDVTEDHVIFGAEPVQTQEEPKTEAASEEHKPDESVTEDSADKKPSAKEMKASLDELNIKYKGNASKTDLAALLEEHAE